ncbi:MAG TPA: alpha-1,4-glucan--maltose-1-phosphate maltosyltransferase [Candidatus Binatia bacterium]|nr:alpha-1,4-glucan--maltose-1-phosphate maltosyltransferase [Candidatus Binatia bacterium]
MPDRTASSTPRSPRPPDEASTGAPARRHGDDGPSGTPETAPSLGLPAEPVPLPAEGRRRVVIEGVAPAVDGGRFPVKRILGDVVVVEADVFADGHDELAVRLRHRPPRTDGWIETPMEPLGNDHWRGRFTVERIGRHEYAVAAWVDHFATWRRDLEKRLAAGQDVAVDLRIGAEHARAAAARARKVAGTSDPGAAPAAPGAPSTTASDADRLEALAVALADAARPVAERTALALGSELGALMAAHPDRRFETVLDPPLAVVVDPPHARFSTWYELFPRSASPHPDRPGTLRDVIARLDYVADLGFDVLYLPPIHPIGTTHRKGRNNAPTAGPNDPGVPWAIGGPAGGHDAVDPGLGTLADLEALVEAAEAKGIRIALDLAFQASPDHPYVRDHPSWFRARPDGTIQYAENPPKKYQDIYPFDFETDDWRELWAELLRIVRFWIARGIRIFRVDNPHTKPFAFWEWLIGEVKRTDPDVLFLSEAFTRPKIMYRLAKLGFSQSYTYFTWRTTKQELTEYFTELSRPPLTDFFRPNLWPNTPDILHEYLQLGGRPAFIVRLVLAATIGTSYGIYGPAYELLVATPREPGSEEYLDSEKYEIRHWNLDAAESIAPVVRRVNAIRRAHPALQADGRLAFHAIDNDELLAYSRRSADGSDRILVVVNLDPHHVQAGTLELPLAEFGLPADHPFEVEDLLDGQTYLWHGPRNGIVLDPTVRPAHVFALRAPIRTEADFAADR